MPLASTSVPTVVPALPSTISIERPCTADQVDKTANAMAFSSSADTANRPSSLNVTGDLTPASLVAKGEKGDVKLRGQAG
jgi:hypothetical protein